MSDASLPVYIVHWDAPEWCRSSALSILASTGVNVELTVVDNGQDRGPPLAEVLPPDVRVLAMAGNTGFTGGANAALADWRERFPDAELAVIGSHDLHVRPGTLAALRATAEARPDAGIVAPVITGPMATSGGVLAGRRSFLLQVEGLAETTEVVERDWALGACILLRRRCVDEVGGFDERFGSYGEDVDYGLRATERGWKVLVVTTAEAWGLGEASPRAIRSKAANGVILTAKRVGPAGAARGLAQLVVLTMRGTAAAVLPWRTPGQRAESRRWARERAGALVQLVGSRRLYDVLRDRDGRSDAPSPR